MKDEDIKAWNRFIDEVEAIHTNDPGGSYFADLLEYRQRVSMNIQNDFDPFVGIYTSDVKLKAERKTYQDKVEDLRKTIESLKDHVAELKKWDIRELNKRMKEVEEEENRLEEERKDIERRQMVNLS